MKKIKSVPKTVERVVEKVTEMASELVEEPGGWEAAHGKRILVHATNYNYSGILSGVNSICVELTDASVVFETGPYTDKKFKDAQKTPRPITLFTNSVECFWVIE